MFFPKSIDVFFLVYTNPLYDESLARSISDSISKRKGNLPARTLPISWRGTFTCIGAGNQAIVLGCHVLQRTPTGTGRETILIVTHLAAMLHHGTSEIGPWARLAGKPNTKHSNLNHISVRLDYNHRIRGSKIKMSGKKANVVAVVNILWKVHHLFPIHPISCKYIKRNVTSCVKTEICTEIGWYNLWF